MGKYTTSRLWADTTPIPLDDGGPNPLAAIAYTDEYTEAMGYLRAVMASDEKSERALALTEEVIWMNAGFYTVWLYRADNVFALGKDLHQELLWLNKVALKHLKNYQIWHHRQTIMSRIPSLPSTELPFLSIMFSKDFKNYHVWSYRQWLVRHFSLWEASPPHHDEIAYVEKLLGHDVRNNSAWNHRWFIVFGRFEKAYSTTGPAMGLDQLSQSVIDREIEYAKGAIEKAPQNPSPWNYLRGILRLTGQDMDTQQVFAERFADLEKGKEDQVRSSHALDFLADIYEEQLKKDNGGGESADNDGAKGKGRSEETGDAREKAGKALELLAVRYDPIRKNYWNWRRGMIGLGEVGA